MFIGNLIYSYSDILVIMVMIMFFSVVGYFYFKELEAVGALVTIIFFVVITTGGILGRYYYENMANSVNNAENTLVSSKYTIVKKYKVKAYLLTNNKKNAQVVLTNGKKIENVDVKRITKLSTENKTKVSFYDINLKKKYRPINNKNKFNRQTLVIEKKTKGSQVK